MSKILFSQNFILIFFHGYAYIASEEFLYIKFPRVFKQNFPLVYSVSGKFAQNFSQIWLIFNKIWLHFGQS